MELRIISITLPIAFYKTKYDVEFSTLVLCLFVHILVSLKALLLLLTEMGSDEHLLQYQNENPAKKPGNLAAGVPLNPLA